MHSMLKLSNLSALPPHLRKTAREAANRSLPDLLRLRASLTTLPDAEKLYLMPAFYANLNVLEIPSTDQLDADPPSFKTRAAITRAVLALRGLSLLVNVIQGIPHEACPDLWRRVWPWLNFLHTFHEQLPPLLSPDTPPSDRETCIDFLTFVGFLQLNKFTAELFIATPGFRFMMCRAWFFSLQSESPLADMGRHNISYFFAHHMKATDRHNLDELVDGAGGSFHDLASLVVRHISQTIPSRQTPLTSQLEVSLRGVLSMVCETEREAMNNARKEIVLGPLLAALVHHGAVPALTTVACALPQSSSVAGLEIPLGQCYIILGRILSSPEGFRLLPDALEAGLLVALLSATKCSFIDKIYPHLTYFISGILGVSMVYYKVLLKMEAAVLEVAELEKDAVFVQSKLFTNWTRFRSLVEERLGVLNAFEAAEEPFPKACDNLMCGHISGRRDFLRCSGCQSAYYCSKKCQKQDWLDGHRKLCTPNRLLCLSEAFTVAAEFSEFTVSASDANTDLSIRERLFLRTLVQADYGYGSPNGADMMEVRFMNQNPGVNFFTLFDYTSGAAYIAVHAVADADALGLGEQWVEEAARAARSGGRLRLHLLRVVEGGVSRCWLVPLRSGTSRIYDGMQRIAGALPKDQDTWNIRDVVLQVRAVVMLELEGPGEPTPEIH
ncbi:hypothetical protein DFH06DRAFT_1197743 [Mycena polygramma]|nr:hypothetical protein DFH06DRAFT_1197743 [Mycena polygramma]